MKRTYFVAIICAVALSCVAATSEARSSKDIEERLDRVERLLDSQGLVQLLEQLEQLQQQVQSMQGDLEVQDHGLAQLKKRQRELYLDIDRRLRQLEVGGITRTPTATPEPAPSLATPETGFAPVATAPVVSQDGPEANAAYQAAFKLLKEGRYERAIASFQSFLGAWPNSTYSDNAQYWLGEAYYVTRQFQLSVTEFETLIERFPDSQKRTHALLKIGYIYHELGDRGQARQVLTRLKSQHPGTTAARLADERLQSMRIEEQR